MCDGRVVYFIYHTQPTDDHVGGVTRKWENPDSLNVLDHQDV